MSPSSSESWDKRAAGTPVGIVAQPRLGRIPLPSLRLRVSERKLLLLVVDLALINGALLAAVMWVFDLSAASALDQTKWFVTVSVVWLGVAYLFDVYNLAHAAQPVSIARRMGMAAATAAIAYTLVPLLTPPLDARRYIFAFVALAVVGMTAWRVFYAAVFVQPWFVQRALVVGAGQAGHELADTLHFIASSGQQRPGTGYQVLGYIDDRESLWGKAVNGATVLGGHELLLPALKQWAVDEVILAITHRHSIRSGLMSALIACSEQGIRVTTMAAFYERMLGRLPVTHLGNDVTQVLNMHEAAADRFYLAARRGMDLALCVPALVMLALCMPAVALANRLLCRGPLFYRQTRVGQGGRSFEIVKFRSMTPDAEQATGAVWAQTDDPRITRVGHWLRKTRLDELPQVLNIVRGEMSFIGPRPERPEFVEELAQSVPFYRARHAVKPGLTGWAQVQYRYTNSVDDSRIKLEYDLYYVKHMNPLLDLQILVRTAAIVLQLKGL